MVGPKASNKSENNEGIMYQARQRREVALQLSLSIDLIIPDKLNCGATPQSVVPSALSPRYFPTCYVLSGLPTIRDLIYLLSTLLGTNAGTTGEGKEEEEIGSPPLPHP